MSIERIGLIATRWKVPLPDLLDGLRFLTGKDCLRCNVYTDALRAIHIIGYDKAKGLVKEIIEAKSDIIKLAEIKKKIPR